MIQHSRAQLFALAALVAAAPGAFGHGTASAPDKPGARAIEFPNTVEHQTMVVDLHTHSVFSDGHVWPSIRVEEALRDGLDAMAVTEHLEWQPHLADIPHPDRNRAYQEAASAAADAEIIIIPGSEITRHPPANHINAVFIQDANALFQPPEQIDEPFDPRSYYATAGQWPAQEAVQRANDQGAFVFWNHPFGTAGATDGIARMNDFHRDNAASGLLHGIEVANGATYSEEAFQIALDHDLALIGVSDVHELIDWDYEPQNGGHRPVNLVFVDKRSAAGIKDALFAHRTVVWYRNLLLGRERDLQPLLDASLRVKRAAYQPASQILEVTLINHSDARFQLRNLSRYTFEGQADLVEVAPHESLTLRVKPGEVLADIELEFEVLNALTAPKQPAHRRFQLQPVPPAEDA